MKYECTYHVNFIKTLVRREQSGACAVVGSTQDDQTELTSVNQINARRSRIHQTQFDFEVVLTILHENSSQSRARSRIVNPGQLHTSKLKRVCKQITGWLEEGGREEEESLPDLRVPLKDDVSGSGGAFR